MKLTSQIGTLAKSRGFRNPDALSFEAKVPRQTIYNVWQGDITNIRLQTIVKIAHALNHNVQDLYEVTMM